MAAAHVGTSAGGTTTGDMKRPFDFIASDFATIVTTTTYVDKSLMIRDVYNASSRILITAPPRFGKSTNLDMVKRFFEIEVDACGSPKPVYMAKNYRLFKDYNLEICKDIDFFKEHFGKHPVVHIGFEPLGRVDNPANMLDALKMIVKNSLAQHNYILQYSLKEYVFSGITGFDEDDFRKCVTGIAKNVDEVKLADSFNYLSTLLKRFFDKKVFVLIDGYDAFLESPLFENNADREKMVSFVESSIGQLLDNVYCVERVLITGVIPVIFEGSLCSQNNIEFCHFLHCHPFTKYYGLTSAEVDTVLSKVVECDEERRNVKSTINDYYNAYKTCNPEICVYNVFSVLQYVCRRTVQSYWCDRRYINKFKKCFKDGVIRLMLQEVLLGDVFLLDVSQSLLMSDVLKVNSMIARGQNKHQSEVDLFFVLFFHFGYLSVASDLGRGVVWVNILSEEIKYELAKAIFDENRELYTTPHMNDVLLALDAFQSDGTNLHQNCESFRKNINKLYRHKKFLFMEILECLYVNLVRNAKRSRVRTRRLGPIARSALLLKNKNQAVICLTCSVSQRAEIVHQEVTNDRGEDHIFDGFNDVGCKIIIAIGLGDSTVEIEYSYYFKTGKNSREVTTLT